MAILELRRRLASEFDQEQLWRDSFTALLSGFAT